MYYFLCPSFQYRERLFSLIENGLQSCDTQNNSWAFLRAEFTGGYIVCTVGLHKRKMRKTGSLKREYYQIYLVVYLPQAKQLVVPPNVDFSRSSTQVSWSTIDLVNCLSKIEFLLLKHLRSSMWHCIYLNTLLNIPPARNEDLHLHRRNCLLLLTGIHVLQIKSKEHENKHT